MTTKPTLRDKTIQVRVTEDEYNTIEKKANELGISLSNFIRLVCLHVRIDFSVIPDINDVDKK